MTAADMHEVRLLYIKLGLINALAPLIGFYEGADTVTVDAELATAGGLRVDVTYHKAGTVLGGMSLGE